MLRFSSLVPVFASLLNKVASVTIETQLHYSSHGSLCIEGKLVPEFYLLGGKKCATSSIASQLVQRGLVNSPRGGEDKEWNFFFEWYMAGKSENLTQQHSDWHSSLLPCPVRGPKQVVASYGTHFGAEVPFPGGMMPHETLWFREWSDSTTQAHGFSNRTIQAKSLQNTPSLLRAYYGQHANRLIFALMMREPLSRMHSEWYFARASYQECTACKVAANFQDSLVVTMNAMQSSPQRVTDWLWKSLYAYMIEGYLEQFDAKQMLIIPYKQYTRSTTSRNVCEKIRQDVQLSFACWDAPIHGNSHPHPPLQDDLTEEVQTQFNELIAEHNARLVRDIARFQLKGTWLAGYAGSFGDEQQIHTWLEQSW